jgi:hypothetical protein
MVPFKTGLNKLRKRLQIKQMGLVDKEIFIVLLLILGQDFGQTAVCTLRLVFTYAYCPHRIFTLDKSCIE